MFNFGDEFFKRVEQKTNVNKETILGLANKLQKGNLRDEGTLRDLIHEIGNLTGNPVPKDKEDKIITAVLNDNIPTNLDKMLDN